MPKRFKYFLLSSLSGVLFWLLLFAMSLEAKYYIMVGGGVLIAVGYWLVMDLWFDRNWEKRIVPLIMPLGYWLSFGLFSILIPQVWWLDILLAIGFAITNYLILLMENIYMVTIGSVTVPLYRAAYTTGSIMSLGLAFFCFNTMWSYRWSFWINMLISMAVSLLLFWYHFWAVSIQLKDDGIKLPKMMYILAPSIVIGELAVVLSFWPVGIFKGSIYLVSAAYVIMGLIEADIRGRLFRKNWLAAIYQSLAVILAAFVATKWGV